MWISLLCVFQNSDDSESYQDPKVSSEVGKIREPDNCVGAALTGVEKQMQPSLYTIPSLS